jgi:adenine-specific DNA methylase
VENYFNYFTEIEEQFQKRRGTGLLLSTLDWALIETWKDAGIPLEAVLRGIDSAFDKYDQRPSKTRKVNSLAYCSQEVLAAAEDMKEAAVGAQRDEQPGQTLGFAAADIAAFFRRNAAQLESAKLPQCGAVSVQSIAQEDARTLRELATDLEDGTNPRRLEDLERRMTVMEEKLFAVLLAATPDEEIVAVRARADRDLAPYRSKMPSAQIEQLHKQYVQKRLLENYGLPRLSLFYM